MWVAVVIGPRDRLDAALVEEVRAALKGGPPRWLAPATAAEFALQHRPGDLGEVASALRDLAVDLAVVPVSGRRKRALIADMDSTMIEQECIDELADMAGVGREVAEITARAMNGEIGFEGALTERVAQLEGLPVTAIDRVLAERIRHRAGGRLAVATMRAQGARTVLVSGGFTAFAGPIGAALGFDEVRANVLEAQDGVLTGRVVPPILGRDAKVVALEETAARIDAQAADILAVGDGANDLGMLERAGLGVAMHAKPAVAERVDVRIDHADLTALLYLQGYGAVEFAT